ncbi:leucyl aminopeptidase [Moniliophthora roreri]|nr:leucyl aminopeptidase [Moniliophthora roreri]
MIIRTDLKNSKFFGVVEINLKINEQTSQIILNVLDLAIGEVSVATTDGQVFTPSTHIPEKEKERVAFRFPNQFVAGSTARLMVKFEADLTDSLAGYYRSSWKSKAGEAEFYALTQFKPTAARRAFPCWDEPALKATFSMNMISLNDTVNLFNMPISTEKSYNTMGDPYGLFTSASPEEKRQQWKITRFKTTPKMSTYVVAYANGRPEHIESIYTSPLTGNIVPLRVYASSSNIQQCHYLLEVTGKLLGAYEKAFEIEYPLPKLDIFVIDDFEAGAVGNWGLIIGRSSVYCVDSETASLRKKQDLVHIQSHEVAHMWFGNMTMMEWWTYLYLNEVIFWIFETDAIAPDERGNHIQLWPEWKMTTSFVFFHLNAALILDSLLSAHPVEVDCSDAKKIGQIFDALSYSKAASVLRMLSEHVGEERFLKGVSLYLKDKLYNNSVIQDLWKGISAATGSDVSEMMESYITKSGYPVLTVTENVNGIHVRQDRFLKTGLATGSDNETIWHVPLNIKAVSAGGEVIEDKVVLREREADFAVNTNLPFKLNGSSSGYYRVLYSPQRLNAIVTELTKPNSPFDGSDRLGLVLDIIAFARVGLVRFGVVLSTMFKFQPCREYLPWSVIALDWARMTSLWWEDSQVQELLKKFGKALFKPLIKELGFETSPSDSQDTALLRECAIRHALLAGDEDVIQELKNRFNRFMETGDYATIPSGIEEAIFTAAVRHGGPAEYEAVKKLIDNARRPSKSLAMMALCATEDPELIQKTFDYMLETKDRDLFDYFKALGQNVKTRRKLVEIFKDKYDGLNARLRNGFGIGIYVKFTFNNLSSDADYRDMQEFFKDKDTSTCMYPSPLIPFKQTPCASKFVFHSICGFDRLSQQITMIYQFTADLVGWLEAWKLQYH